jgi:hypothetical protein
MSADPLKPVIAAPLAPLVLIAGHRHSVEKEWITGLQSLLSSLP